MERDVLQTLLAMGFFGVLGVVITAIAAITAIYYTKKH